VRVEWEVVEWTEGDEGCTSPGKRKSGDVEAADGDDDDDDDDDDVVNHVPGSQSIY